jgi:hypothetical protein
MSEKWVKSPVSGFFSGANIGGTMGLTIEENWRILNELSPRVDNY